MLSPRTWCMSRVTAVALVAASLSVVTVSTASTAAVAASKNKVCANVTAGGHSYSVSATNVSCATARQAAAKLAGKRLKNNATRTTLSGGPSGYQCAAAAKAADGKEQVAANVQISGNCARGLGGLGGGSSPYFNWSIQNVLG